MRSQISFKKPRFPNTQSKPQLSQTSANQYTPAILYTQQAATEYLLLSGRKAICQFMKYLHSEIEPAIEFENGDFIWYKYGQIHRDGGPAQKSNGVLYWFNDGQLHREDGPAIVYPDGRSEWYSHGVRYDPPTESISE